MLELPAGKIDVNEDTLDTAQSESCVKRPATRPPNGAIWAPYIPTIGYADERIEIYLAQQLSALEHERT